MVFSSKPADERCISEQFEVVFLIRKLIFVHSAALREFKGFPSR